MNLGALQEACDSASEDFDFYGLDISGQDIYVDGIFPRNKLREISLKALFKEDGQLDGELVDFINLLVGEEKKIILELDSSQSFDIEWLALTASLLNFDIAVEPVLDGCYESQQKFIDICYDLFVESNKHFNFKNYIQPISGYFLYMIQRTLGYTPPNITEDKFAQKFYVDRMTSDEMDFVKEQWDERILADFGGEEGLKSMVNAIGMAQVEKLTLTADTERKYSRSNMAKAFSPAPAYKKLIAQVIETDMHEPSFFVLRAFRKQLPFLSKKYKLRRTLKLREMRRHRVPASVDKIFNVQQQ